MDKNSVFLQIYAHVEDRWMMEERYPSDKQTVAVEAAKRLAREPGVSGVRVIRETWDDDDEVYREFTVFDSTKIGKYRR